ncbi:MAG: glycosyltransferase family 4 protein [Acidobacteria bacterium]|nr:glycosyltransferase family 4 protein [Acidobacteriota bacterium]
MTPVLDARTATPRFPGIGRYVVSLAAAMGRLVGDGAGAGAGVPAPRLLVDGGSATVLPDVGLERVRVASGPRSVSQQWEVRGALRRSGAGLFHATWFLTPWFPGVPLLAGIHDLIPLDFPEYFPFPKRALIRIAIAMAVRRAHTVLTISEASRQRLAHHFPGAAGKTVSIPLAAAPEFDPAAEARAGAVKEALGIDREYVLYVGSNKPHKNLALLFDGWKEALRRDPGLGGRFVLVVTGRMDPRYPGAETDPVRRELAGRVVFTGPAADELLPALYAGAAVFVFPSRQEGFGLPVLEAMACGTPVICGNASSLPEVAADAALLVPADEPRVLAEALLALLGDPERRVSMRARSLRQAARFSWETTARRTLELYRAILSGRPGPGQCVSR